LSSKQSIAEQIDVALAEVTAAEGSLSTLLGELRSGVRAEKVTVSDAVEKAFARLRNSRQTLSRLRESLTDE
jgi:hypothetical protein